MQPVNGVVSAKDGVFAKLQQNGNQTINTGSQEGEVSKWPEPLGEAAFHGLAGDLVRKLEPHTEADPAAILLQFLVAFGNVIGRMAHFVAEADRHFLNLFAVLVGVTSKGRKGTSWGQTKSLLGGADDAWLSNCITGGLSSGEGLIWAVRDAIEKTEPIREKKIITGYQNVITDEGVEDKRLLVVESEFASALKVATRAGNTLSPVIRDAWDKGTLKSLTKNSPAKATNAHTSIVGHITKIELNRNLEETEAANGFANRFLWCCVKRSKSLPEGGNWQQEDFSELSRRLKVAVESAKIVGEIKRDEEARELWISKYDELSEGKPGMLGAVTGRAEAQVGRLACIYALLDLSTIVQRVHLEAALEVWRYCEDSARFIFGEAMGDPVADQILGALREAAETGLTRTQISELFKHHVSAPSINRALLSLTEAGKISSQKESTEGRPAERIFLNSVAKKAKKAKEAPSLECGTPVNSLNSLNSQQGLGTVPVVEEYEEAEVL